MIPESYPVAVPITALAFSPDDAEVAASGYHEINFWKVADGSLDRRLRGLAERVYEVAYSPDGKWMATASGDPGQFGAVKLWLAEPGGGGKPVRDLLETHRLRLRRRLQPRQQAASPPPAPTAPSGSGRSSRARSWRRSRTTPTGSSTWPSAPTASGSPAPAATRRARSSTWPRRSRSSPSPATPRRSTPSRSAPTARPSPPAARTTRSASGTPTTTASRSATIGGFGGAVFKLQYTPDGKELVACGADKTVRVFDANGAPARTLQGHADWVYTFAISPDGKTVASGSWDGEVRLWNLADGKPLRTILAAPGLKPASNAQASAESVRRPSP